MFERGKKDEAPTGQGFGGTEASSAPRASSGSRESAVIGRSIHIDGDLRGEEDLRIEGDVSGTIQLKNNSLTIGQDGKVRADLYAKAVVIDGTVEGDVYGSERVSVRKNARVRGNITSPSVSLEEGANFEGSIEMDPKAVEAALGKSAGKVVEAKPKTVADKPRDNAPPSGSTPSSPAKSVG